MTDSDPPEQPLDTMAFQPSDVAVADEWITRRGMREIAPGHELVVLVSARSRHAAQLDSFTRSLSITADVEPADPEAPPTDEPADAESTEAPSGVVDAWTSQLPPDLPEEPFIVVEAKVVPAAGLRVRIHVTGSLGQGETKQLRAPNGTRVSCSVTGGRVRFVVELFESSATFVDDLGVGEESKFVKSDGRCRVTALQRARFAIAGRWEKRR